MQQSDLERNERGIYIDQRRQSRGLRGADEVKPSRRGHNRAFDLVPDEVVRDSAPLTACKSTHKL